MNRAVAAGLCFWLLSSAAATAEPRIVGMALKGGGRGLMLVLSADEQFPADVETQVKSLSPTTVQVTVTMRGVGYGLGVHRFTDLPEGSPVSGIAARVQEEYGMVEISVDYHVPSPAGVSARAKGRDLLVLLSAERLAPFSWQAPIGAAESDAMPAEEQAAAAVPVVEPVEVAPVVAPRAEPQAEAVKAEVQPQLMCLRDMMVVERGCMVQLHLALSGEATPRVRCDGDQVIILFPRVANCLAEHRLDPPVGRYFRSIELKQRTHDGTEWLGVIVTLAPGEHPPVLVRSEPGRTSVVVVAREEAYAVWTARGGQYAAAAFAAEPLEAPAVASVPEAADTAAPEQIQGYYVTTGNKVNVRSSPSSEEQNVVGKLPRGATVALMETMGDWRRVAAGDVRGWVFGSLLTPQSPAGEAAETLPTPVDAPVVKAAGMLPSISAIASVAAIGQAIAPAPAPPAPVAPAAPPAGTAMTGPTGVAAAAAAPAVPARAADTTMAPPVNVVQYTIYGRDPFLPHVRRIDEALPSVENLSLVGILYDRSDRIALLQDELFREKSYALREQEPINSGVLWRINPSSVVFLITELGVSRASTLELHDVSPTKLQKK